MDRPRVVDFPFEICELGVNRGGFIRVACLYGVRTPDLTEQFRIFKIRPRMLWAPMLKNL